MPYPGSVGWTPQYPYWQNYAMPQHTVVMVPYPVQVPVRVEVPVIKEAPVAKAVKEALPSELLEEKKRHEQQDKALTSLQSKLDTQQKEIEDLKRKPPKVVFPPFLEKLKKRSILSTTAIGSAIGLGLSLAIGGLLIFFGDKKDAKGIMKGIAIKAVIASLVTAVGTYLLKRELHRYEAEEKLLESKA